MGHFKLVYPFQFRLKTALTNRYMHFYAHLQCNSRRAMQWLRRCQPQLQRRSKARVCGRSLAGTAGLNPARGKDVFLVH